MTTDEHKSLFVKGWRTFVRAVLQDVVMGVCGFCDGTRSAGLTVHCQHLVRWKKSFEIPLLFTTVEA